MAIQQEQQNPCPFLDALYCEEEKWVDEEEEVEEEDESFQYSNNFRRRENPFLHQPSSFLEQDLLWEDKETLSLFSKEKDQQIVVSVMENDVYLCMARKEAVDWMLKVNARYGFSILTAILGLNYLDRFICSVYYQRDKPWMIQLVAVACLSLAAKVEETQVPLLLDFQVVGTKYMFEAKAIQRMELLVLSTLKWKMHPVTPLSFVNHIIRRLGLKTHLHWEFLNRCERLLLSIISDWRSVGYLPSVLATATMMHVIDQIEPFKSIEYQDQLLDVLKTNKEKVKECYELILELQRVTSNSHTFDQISHKRKYEHQTTIPCSPNGVIDIAFLSCDRSNDSWGLGEDDSNSSSREELLLEPLFKKNRTQDQCVS